MNQKFIYVFDARARDVLLSKGYTLIKGGNSDNVYIFAFDPHLDFETADFNFALSNTLTF